MSKKNTNKIITKNNPNNEDSSINHYKVIIKQESTITQNKSIDIMIDNSYQYFKNYNYKPNETEISKSKNPPHQDNTNKVQLLTNQEQNMTAIKMKLIEGRKQSNDVNDTQNIADNSIDNNSTNKIDYRYSKKIPSNNVIKPQKMLVNDDNDESQLYWLATYGRLMKRKKIIKILNYYNNKPNDKINKDEKFLSIKEKTLVIKDFEIYFCENNNKPFIKFSKGSKIYAKLYLLSLKQISFIFSYINRIEYTITSDRLNYLQRKGDFEVINENNNGIILPYCFFYYLGKYMNTNIYTFSNNIDFNLDESTFKKEQRISSYTDANHDNRLSKGSNMNFVMNNTNINKMNYKLPNSKKLAKLVKTINFSFPDFSLDDIINYLIPDNKYLDSLSKISEIKIIFSEKKSLQNKILLSSMVRDTIRGVQIQPPQSIISSICPAESLLDNNSPKNSDIFQSTHKKYLFPIKDDYKFRTINANEKENNNNPLIIYVSDNFPNINVIEGQKNLNINLVHNSTKINNNDLKNNKLIFDENDINSKTQQIDRKKIMLNQKSVEVKKKDMKLDKIIKKNNKGEQKIHRHNTNISKISKKNKNSRGHNNYISNLYSTNETLEEKQKNLVKKNLI